MSELNTKTRNKRMALECLRNDVMFYKNFADEQNADGSPGVRGVARGSGTLTHTVSRSATTPATYFDAQGVMQVTTTSNEPRMSKGYYDATGWHYAPHWLIEGESTNILLNTDGKSSSDGIWTNWANLSTVISSTASQVAPSITGIADSYAQRIVYNDGADTDKTVGFGSINSAAGTLAEGEVVTISFWIRTQTSITPGKFSMSFCYRNAAATLISTTDFAFEPTTTWVRRSVTVTAPALTSRFNIKFLCNVNIDQGNSVDFEVYGVQVEKQAYPSSFIPTTTAALTRNAETTNTYTTAGNFPAPSGNNCLSFDGTNDVATFGDLGDITNVTLRLQSRPVDQQLFTINNNATGAVTVVSNVLTFGAGLTAGTITVDGVAKTPAQAGVLINDKAYHTVSIDLASVAASDFRLGTNATDFGDMFVQSLSTTGHSWSFTEGAGTNLDDSIGANDGTISGATWSKDTYSGSVMMKYRPIMMPNEQDATGKIFFNSQHDATNNIRLIYGSNANNFITFYTRSNDELTVSSSALTTWSRYASHTLIATWSTTANSAGKKLNLYIDGVLVATNSNFAVPAGVLPASFSIQSSAGQAMGLEAIAVCSGVMSASDAAAATRIMGDPQYGR